MIPLFLNEPDRHRIKLKTDEWLKVISEDLREHLKPDELNATLVRLTPLLEEFYYLLEWTDRFRLFLKNKGELKDLAGQIATLNGKVEEIKRYIQHGLTHKNSDLAISVLDHLKTSFGAELETLKKHKKREFDHVVVDHLKQMHKFIYSEVKSKTVADTVVERLRRKWESPAIPFDNKVSEGLVESSTIRKRVTRPRQGKIAEIGILYLAKFRLLRLLPKKRIRRINSTSGDRKVTKPFAD